MQLESHSWSWSGSDIPIIESRINYFKELLDKVQKQGVNYIKHCILISNQVEMLENYKKEVVRREFLSDW